MQNTSKTGHLLFMRISSWILFVFDSDLNQPLIRINS